MRILFFGTPQIAVPYLDWLSQHEEVVGVVTKKDEPVGRGYQLTPPPVKVLAQKKNLPVFQFEGKWTDEKYDTLKKLGADVGVAVAYGRLMPRPVFMAPRLGSFNIHFSLLPKYRGAGPLQWSLINGDKETGVTAFWIEEGMDSGPICHHEAIPIDPADNATTLKEKLIPLGIDVMEKVLKNLKEGKIVKNPQEGKAVMAPMLKKEDGHINWEKSAEAISDLIRGVYEWPGAHTVYGSEKQLKIFRAHADSSQTVQKTAGEIVDLKKNEGFWVQCGDGRLFVSEVQPEGKKKMAAWAFWVGSHLKIGDRLG